MKFGFRELLMVTVMLGLCAGTWFMILAPNDARRADMLKQKETKQKALVNLRESTAGIDDLGHKIDELQKAIAFFENKLPQEKEMDKILTDAARFYIVDEVNHNKNLRFQSAQERQHYIDDRLQLQTKTLGLDEPWYSPKSFTTTVLKLPSLAT